MIALTGQAPGDRQINLAGDPRTRGLLRAVYDASDGAADGFASIDDGEVWLQHVHIPEYTQGTWTNHAPRRKRKVLMHRAEIDKLIGKTKEGGLTLVPLDMYFKDGKVKATLALAKGKKSYDKRQDLAERDSRREMQKAFGRYVKGRR